MKKESEETEIVDKESKEDPLIMKDTKEKDSQEITPYTLEELNIPK